MKNNKLLQLLLISTALVLVNVSSAIARPGPTVVKWTVEAYSSLSIAGKSNVNSFNCSIFVPHSKDTIVGTHEASMPVSLTGNIKVSVLNFDCHSKPITKDLGKTLKADKYPVLTIRFLNLQSMPTEKADKEMIKGEVEVELAGVAKKFVLDYTFSSRGSGFMILNGHRNFSFTDFSLEPPCKLGCLIKIKDDFEVNFLLVLKAL